MTKINVTSAKKNLQFFFLALLIGSVIAVGLNGLEKNLEQYFAQQLRTEHLTAQLVTAEETQAQQQTPPRNFEAKLNASSAISVWTDLEQSKILFEKNACRASPIASLSKLMTSYVVMEIPETYSLDKTITVSRESVKQDGNFNLKPGEKLTVKNLLAMALIESSNDAAYALADIIERKGFVGLMNHYAGEMGLDQTKFYNPTGLKAQDQPENHSSAQDLVKLSKSILEEHPKIFELSSHQSYKVVKPDGSLHHRIEQNTNELLGEVPNLVGGKTGYTDGAEQCLLTVVEREQGSGYFINVILGSNDRFGEMKKLIEKEQHAGN